MKELLTAFPYTLKLSAFAMIIAILIGIPCGIISAIKQYSWFDTITMIFAMVGLSMPVFWLGLLLILLFSVHLRWLPSSGFSTFKAMILPSVALAAQSISMVTRMTRSSMLGSSGRTTSGRRGRRARRSPSSFGCTRCATR